MDINYKNFIKAIQEKKLVRVTFDSKEKGIITRLCVPFDYGPWRKAKDGINRFHLYDLDSPEGKHNLSILPNQVIKIELTDQYFEPADYVHWSPNRFIKRDRGIIYS